MKKEPNNKKNEFSEEFLEKCAEGDPATIRKFFQIYAQDIYNFPLKVFHLDEDAASDFFIYAYERLVDGNRFRSFQHRSSFRTWFYTVLRNLVLDWMRTIRELEVISIKAFGDDEKEFDFIGNIPDPRSLKNTDDDLVTTFYKSLNIMPVEMRTVFKLSYIYYLDLETNELEYLALRNQKPPSKILQELLELRQELATKELKNMGTEDKITSLYLTISELKLKKDRLNNLIERQNNLTETDITNIEKINKGISKKSNQHQRLLKKKRSGHLIVRTPYNKVAQLLKTSEGNISVKMMRILGRLQKADVA